MPTKYVRDQRGVAMLLELVLVAAVLALVGVAVYQANSHNTTVPSAISLSKPAASTVAGLADSAAQTTLTDSAADASLSATAESATDELSATDTDITNLGSTADGSF